MNLVDGVDERPRSSRCRETSPCRQLSVASKPCEYHGAILSLLTLDPIKNLRRSNCLLWRMRIEGTRNSAPALLDDLVGKLPRVGLDLKGAGRASEWSVLVLTPWRYVRTVGNVPNIVFGQAISPEDAQSTLPLVATMSAIQIHRRLIGAWLLHALS
jgi:hypothetical protein